MRHQNDEELQQFIVKHKQQVLKYQSEDKTIDSIDTQMVNQLIRDINEEDTVKETLLKEEALTLKN